MKRDNERAMEKAFRESMSVYSERFPLCFNVVISALPRLKGKVTTKRKVNHETHNDAPAISPRERKLIMQPSAIYHPVIILNLLYRCASILYKSKSPYKSNVSLADTMLWHNIVLYVTSDHQIYLKILCLYEGSSTLKKKRINQN